jgi:hypothetical protein
MYSNRTRKPVKISKPPAKDAKSKGVFTETEGDIKEGGLRKMLKVKDDYKFKLPELRKLDKVEIGKQFSFQDKVFKMTKLMKKRITLAINMMKK